MQLTTLATIALFTSATAAAFSSDGEKKSPDPDAVIWVSSQMNQLGDLLSIGHPSHVGFTDPVFSELAATIDRMPGDESMRARMSTYLDDLAERARSTYLTQQDLAVFRSDFAMSRILAHLRDLENRAAGGKWNDVQFDQALENWISRARVFTDAPNPAEYRARFRAVARQAINDARSVNRYAQSIAAAWSKDQLNDAAQVLARRRADGTSTPTDVVRVTQLHFSARRLGTLPDARL